MMDLKNTKTYFYQHMRNTLKDAAEAKFDLCSWCELAMESGILLFIKFVRLVKGALLVGHCKLL